MALFAVLDVANICNSFIMLPLLFLKNRKNVQEMSLKAPFLYWKEGFSFDFIQTGAQP